MSIPTDEEILRITGIPDRVVRNLNITQCYYELSQAMKGLTGLHPNWCTFAVWASKQAGQSIRKEDLVRTFEYYFRHSPEIIFILENITRYLETLNKFPEVKTIRELILKIFDTDAIFEKTAVAIAIGNRKVFEEIGKEFARFLTEFQSESDFTAENIARYCGTLKSGAPPEGQELLNDAFTAYYEAWSLKDSKAKCEMIHYANLLIGFHEQTRLQPEIIEALNAPLGEVDKLRGEIIKELLPGFWIQIRYFLARLFHIKLPLNEILDKIIDLIKRQVREVITRFMMSLYIPGSVVLRLGSNLTKGFPMNLQQITNPKLLELLVRIDPTPDSLEESGANDWGNLFDRIHFIADYFRCYYEHQPLFNTPFTAYQVALMKAGEKPSGPL